MSADAAFASKKKTEEASMSECIKAPLISIIVPVYNVEKYLGKCIESIMAQTYENIEILLVDDGATDTSGAICDAYAEKDARIRVIHKANGGLSDARNRGIEEAKGELLGFIDSDDYIDADMFEVLYRTMAKYDADMSMCGVYELYEGQKVEQVSEIKDFCTDAEGAMKIVMDGMINYAYAVNKLYKRELFNEVRYPVGKIIEDAFVILFLLDKTSKVALTNEKKYYYFHRENSITSNSFRQKHFDCIEAHENNYKFICEKHPSLEKTARMRLYWSRFFVLDKMLLLDGVKKEDYMPLVRYIRGGVGYIVFESILSKSRKIATLVLLFSVRAYKALLVRSNEKNRRINKDEKNS